MLIFRDWDFAKLKLWTQWLIIGMAILYVYTAIIIYYAHTTTRSIRIDNFIQKTRKTLSYLRSSEKEILDKLRRIVNTYEREQNHCRLLMDKLMSRAEFIFTELEMTAEKAKQLSMQCHHCKTCNPFPGQLPGLSSEMEAARRKAEGTARELWFYVEFLLKNIKKNGLVESSPPSKINKSSQIIEATATQTAGDSQIMQVILGNPALPQSTSTEETIKPVISTPLNSSSGGNHLSAVVKDKEIIKLTVEGHLPAMVKDNEIIKLTVDGHLPAMEKEDETIKLTVDGHLPAMKKDEETIKLTMEGHLPAMKKDEEIINLTVDGHLPAVKKDEVKLTVEGLRKELKSYKRTLLHDFKRLREADAANAVRFAMSKKLGRLVQRRLHYLQNPLDCEAAQKVICSTKMCGFSCQIHHFVYCLITAYATKRTLVLGSDVKEQLHGLWGDLVIPLSRSCDNLTKSFDATTLDIKLWNNLSEICLADIETVTLEKLSEEQNILFRRPLPLSVPEDIASKLDLFHGNPSAWWVGQMIDYLLRPATKFKNLLLNYQAKLGFERPVVGVHVRRSDKIVMEAEFHYLKEYMVHVEDYYEQLEHSMTGVLRRVYLATDDPNLLTEARVEYPAYIFISDHSSSILAQSSRNTFEGMKSVLLDIYFLSRCDFLVCTFSSSVCRMAYEWMQTLHGDASQLFRSLDDIYYFGGQDGHNMTATEAHSSRETQSMKTIHLKKGDVISVKGNHWNGFSLGTNQRTDQKGLYPSHKVEDRVKSFPMPTYPQVADDDTV